MLTLYVKTGCPFCEEVLDTVGDLGVTIEEKNIADEAVADELIAYGGKRQVPYLIDSSRGVAMYEAHDIVDYLRTHYNQASNETEGGTLADNGTEIL